MLDVKEWERIQRMANELTRQLQLTELEILIELDRVCKEENLTYFLEGGTLLGALRHGGFIPWDDDIDVLMPREDYNRLIDVFREGKLKGYHLQCIETDPGYWNFFAKLRKNGTTFITKEERYVKSHQGVFIDIFPMEGIEQEHAEGIRKCDFWQPMLRSVLLRRVHMTVQGGSGKKEIVMKLLQGLMAPFSNTALQHFGTRFLKSKPKQAADAYYRAPITRGDKKMNRVWPFEKVYPTETLKFENHDFPVFHDYRWYLEQLYGNTYMELPPEEDRVTHEPWKIEL